MGEKGSSDKLVREGRWGEGEEKHRQVIQTNFNKLLMVCWHCKKRTSFFPRHSEFWIGTVIQSCKLKIKG